METQTEKTTRILPVNLQPLPSKSNMSISTRVGLLKMNSDGEPELSLYQDSIAEPVQIAGAVKTLKAAFPKMGDEFFMLLCKRIGANEFTAKRLEDAVNHVIDNFHYKELNVADIVSFDKRVKLYDKNQIWDECSKGYTTDDFEKVRISGKLYWVKKVDIENSKR